MRHKYDTRALVLARAHTGEATTFLTLLTPDLGLVYARAQSVRKPGAKLAASLATLVESDVVLVRGKEGWRVAGAVLEENWFQKLPSASTRERAARVSGLLLRLIAGEERDSLLFTITKGMLSALAVFPEDAHEAIEILAVLRALSALGLDSGEIPGEAADFASPFLADVFKNRTKYIARINTGIAASGL